PGSRPTSSGGPARAAASRSASASRARRRSISARSASTAGPSPVRAPWSPAERTSGAVLGVAVLERAPELGGELLERAPGKLARQNVPVLPPADRRERDA